MPTKLNKIFVRLHQKMLLFPNCKINIGLNVIKKRTDGYHDLATLFYPLSLSDCLEVNQSKSSNNELEISGIPVDGDPEKNLCLRATRLMQEKYNLSPVSIHLHKIVPMGAGLGGGSADAAYTLVAINTLFGLGLPEEDLLEMAQQIGSDCPFFLMNHPLYATGKGDIFSNINLSLKGKTLVLAKPEVSVSTTMAYSRIMPKTPDFDLKKIGEIPIQDWKNLIYNDFEAVVFDLHPQVKTIKQYFYLQGAIYASMSGSGTSVFGIFDNDVILTGDEKTLKGCFVWKETLQF